MDFFFASKINKEESHIKDRFNRNQRNGEGDYLMTTEVFFPTALRVAMIASGAVAISTIVALIQTWREQSKYSLTNVVLGLGVGLIMCKLFFGWINEFFGAGCFCVAKISLFTNFVLSRIRSNLPSPVRRSCSCIICFDPTVRVGQHR